MGLFHANGAPKTSLRQLTPEQAATACRRLANGSRPDQLWVTGQPEATG